jgi:hypothetical protein
MRDLHEFVFDWDAMIERNPRIQSDMRILLDVVCEMNPGVPREVCAALAASILGANCEATAGNARAFHDDLAWLAAQAGEMTVADGTADGSWTRETRKGQ